jgi:hypothetical protein
VGEIAEAAMKRFPSQLTGYFGDYRAEWSPSLFRDFFVAPPYFASLEDVRPTLLIGGRGTGKTTSLRSLRFDESAARLGAAGVAELGYVGIYVRLNKNQVRGFSGRRIDDDTWRRAFTHYFNVLACIEFCNLSSWSLGLEQKPVDLTNVAVGLGMPTATTVPALREALETNLALMELWVNNPSRVDPPLFSIAEAPLRSFAAALYRSGLLGDRVVYCCIDEYENLFDYQQSIINTYVKHAQAPLSYKIGAKRTGIRSRATIDVNDALRSPDDYAEIDIGHEHFEGFARQVLEHRLSIAISRDKLEVASNADEFLPDLSISDEADLLGADRIATELQHEIAAHLQEQELQKNVTDEQELLNWSLNLPANKLYFLRYWEEGGHGDVLKLARSWRDDPREWSTRLGNHGYSSLFWLSKGRKGVRIRKYYCGLRTFLALASGNIRYFIELIDESLAHAAAEPDGIWHGAVPSLQQTLAARKVARRRLDQLESLSEHGSTIKRLVLGIGKVFFELARDPVGHSPEQNSFTLAGNRGDVEEASKLLHEGVSILAFEVFPRTKATSDAQVRDDEFRLHPIFAPFFEYSHRGKRAITLDASHVLQMLTQPRKAIAALLPNRQQATSDELPPQLALFSSFYDSAT